MARINREPSYRGPMLEVEARLSVIPSVQEIVDIFWDMDSDQQADFFNRLHLKPSLAFQLQYIADSDKLNLNGKMAMGLIGQYAEAE